MFEIFDENGYIGGFLPPSAYTQLVEYLDDKEGQQIAEWVETGLSDDPKSLIKELRKLTPDDKASPGDLSMKEMLDILIDLAGQCGEILMVKEGGWTPPDGDEGED